MTQVKEGFDRVFDLVGSCGRYQYTLLLIVSLQCAILSWHHLGYVFLGAVPNHWCRVPDLDHFGWSAARIRNVSSPLKQNGLDYESCKYYDVDYAMFNPIPKPPYEVNVIGFDHPEANISQCNNGWLFDNSTFTSTIVTEFETVCENRYLVATIQSTYMGGVFVGSLTLGSLSDRLIGRRKSVLISIVLVLFGGILAGFANTYWQLIIFRFFVAFGVAGAYQNCYVLLMEYSGTKSRSKLGMIQQLPFAIGYMLMAVYAYFIRNWRDLQLAFSLSSLVLLSYFIILPESARWLAVVANDTEASIKYLMEVARKNKKEGVTKEKLLEIISSCAEVQEKKRSQQPIFIISESQLVLNQQNCCMEWCRKIWKALKKNVSVYKTLVATPEMRKRTLLIWFLFISVDLVYYGVVFDSARLTDNPYLLVFLGGLSEVPAYTVVVPCLVKWGRRPTIVATFLCTAVCTLGVAYVSVEHELWRMLLSMSGKLFITTSFAVIYLLGTELYPTSTRTTGLAAAVFMGRVGSITAPYIVDGMKTVYTDLPSIIFGITCLVSSIVACFIPETKDLQMADNPHDVEECERKERETRSNGPKEPTTGTDAAIQVTVT